MVHPLRIDIDGAFLRRRHLQVQLKCRCLECSASTRFSARLTRSNRDGTNTLPGIYPVRVPDREHAGIDPVGHLPHPAALLPGDPVRHLPEGASGLRRLSRRPRAVRVGRGDPDARHAALVEAARLVASYRRSSGENSNTTCWMCQKLFGSSASGTSVTAAVPPPVSGTWSGLGPFKPNVNAPANSNGTVSVTG